MNRTRSDFLAPVRLFLLSLGLAAIWIVISFFVGTNSAHADEADSRSLLGGVVSGAANAADLPLTDAATAPVKKVAAALPTVRSAVASAIDVQPVVRVVDAEQAKPVARVVDVVQAKPVARAVDVVQAKPVARVVDVVQAKPVARVATPVAGTIDAVVAPVVNPVARTVAPVVTPVMDSVDRAVDVLPGADRLPNLSDGLGATPTADLTSPVTDLVDDVLVGVTTPATDGALPTLPSLPFLPALPAAPGFPSAGQDSLLPDPALSPVPVGSAKSVDTAASVTAAVEPSAATERTASVSSTPTIMSWVGDLNSGLGVSPAASARPYPDPVPRGPAENGNSALPSTPAASGGATAGGPYGSPSAADLSSSFALALMSGSLLSHAENDALPSPLPLELSSTPD